MAVVMYMFPSLQYFIFKVDDHEAKDIVPIQYEMELVLQFFSYLSLISRVEYKYMSFGVLEGLSLLHLEKSVDAQELSLVSMDEEELAALLVGLDRKIHPVKDITNAFNDSDTSKTKRSSLT